MSILFWGLTLGVVGKAMLAVGILKVHYVMGQERQIGERVVRSFHVEKIITILGVLCIGIGYLCEIYFYNGANLLTCHGINCAASVLSTFVQ